MLRRFLVATILMTLVLSGMSMAQIDNIAIFNESVGWTTVEVAGEATDIIVEEVTPMANDVSVLTDDEMGAFAEENTGDGNLDIIVLFGYLPVSLYTPGNAQEDGSLIELFLEGGDMVLNTADYIFYVSEGGGSNGADGLKLITDTNLDCWNDGNVNSAAELGPEYTPDLPDSFDAPRALKRDQIEAEADWEVEAVFGSNGENNLDPVIIRNVSNGGRVAIAFQVSNDEMPRGPVMSGIISYISETVGGPSAVAPTAKLTTTWGALK